MLALLISLALSVEPTDVVKVAAAPRYAIAEDKGAVSILIQKDVALSRLTMQPGAKVPEHTHDGSSETLYVLEGTCTLILRGTTYTLVAGDAVNIAKGDKHSASVPSDAKSAFVAVQIYSPAGPEQRFLKGKKL